MRRSTVVGACMLPLIVIGVESRALAQPPPSICSRVREHLRDTVIVFQPPSTFTICRDGRVETGVVTDRSVYLELTPTPGPRMFDFRIHGKSSDWAPMGLGAWEALTTRIAGKLRDLDHSGEPIPSLVIPMEAPAASAAPLRPLAAARTMYLAEVTPQYLDALHSVYGEARELPVIAGVVRRWCGALATEAPGTLAAEAELRSSCAAPEVREGAVEQVLKDFEVAVQKASAARTHAREATLVAIAHPEDTKAVADGTRALDEARVAATIVVASAHALRESSVVLARAVGTLRVSLRSVDALRPGVPTYLSTYSTPGNAELGIDAAPSDIAAAGTETTHGASGTATGRYPVFGRHYLDIEAGLGWGAGVPDSILADHDPRRAGHPDPARGGAGRPRARRARALALSLAGAAARGDFPSPRDRHPVHAEIRHRTSSLVPASDGRASARSRPGPMSFARRCCARGSLPTRRSPAISRSTPRRTPVLESGTSSRPASISWACSTSSSRSTLRRSMR